MNPDPPHTHASDSGEQREAEREIVAALARQLGVDLDDQLELEQHIELDGYAAGEIPICVEAFARQGRAKPGQKRKLMDDMCRLLLAERLLGRQCRKILVVCDSEALSFLERSWRHRFAEEFGIERMVVDVSDATRARIRKAQDRQYR